jgi:hypothetical protein
MSKFPYTQTTMLVNSVEATTTVKIMSGMQVAHVVFKSPAGDLGFVDLSPVDPQRTDIKLQAGNQVLLINIIKFQAAFGFEEGSVFINGNATDQDGKNPTDFSKIIANWTAPS